LKSRAESYQLEDQLQASVPETIDALLAADITVIVLTGDKEETAVSVGRLANILHDDHKLLFVNELNSREIKQQIDHALEEINRNDSQGIRCSYALVVNGNAFEKCIVRFPTETNVLLSTVETVICSRATPLQKSRIVRFVKSQLGKIVLAIGDGGNDVCFFVF